MKAEQMKLITRLGQTGLTLTLALYFVVVAFENISDYQTNFEFVKHVLSMDSIPLDSNVQWRAIKSTSIQHLTYCLIIGWEALAGLLCTVGGVRMAIHMKSRGFQAAKREALAGLWIGILLWSFAFITIAGEWFMMWESITWNGEQAALRMFILNGFLMLLLYLPDDEHP